MLPETLTDDDWGLILDRIKRKKCTPILGYGTCSGIFPFNHQMARNWAKHPEYPFVDCSNLAQAAQFMSVIIDSAHPKDQIVEQFKSLSPPDFKDPHEPHSVLASLPFPIYVTTKYDDFIERALNRQHRDARKEVCRWDQPLESKNEHLLKDGSPPSVANPIVYHLYGYIDEREAKSLVLSEEDYLDFLVSISKSPDLISPTIKAAISNTTILLLGYRLDDWNFRILFRSIVEFLQISKYRLHVAVQLAPTDNEAPEEQKLKAQEYFGRYLDTFHIKVYWGKCQDFISELKNRWEESGYGV